MKYFRFIEAEANKSASQIQLPVLKEGRKEGIGGGGRNSNTYLLIFFILSPSGFLMSGKMLIFPCFEYIINAFNFHIICELFCLGSLVHPVMKRVYFNSLQSRPDLLKCTIELLRASYRWQQQSCHMFLVAIHDNNRTN